MHREQILARLEEISRQLKINYYNSIIRSNVGSNRDLYNQCLQSDDWKKKAADIKARDANRCKFCDDQPADEVHHLTYRNLGRESDFELISVCRQCHNLIHDTEVEPVSCQLTQLRNFNDSVVLSEFETSSKEKKDSSFYYRQEMNGQSQDSIYSEVVMKKAVFGLLWLHFIQKFANVRTDGIILNSLPTFVIQLIGCSDLEIRINERSVAVEFFQHNYEVCRAFHTSLKSELDEQYPQYNLQLSFGLVSALTDEKLNPYNCGRYLEITLIMDQILQNLHLWQGFKYKTGYAI